MATTHSQSGQTSGSGVYIKFPRISGFTILEHLHEGSHSSIYRARQDRLGRVVALKVLPEWPPPTDVALERFNRAAYVSAQAPHANLLTLYDTGARDGYYFASLEFVVGQTLQRHLGQVAHTDERFALHVGLQVARALTALHSKDICHRNVKPKNIFIETNGNVRLIGLGLASCKSAFFSPHLDAHPIGTPHFMAPEMIRGCCSDPRSDLYSLGVTLYLMVAGRPPFDVGIPAAIMTKHLNEAPHPLGELRKDLSSEFVETVHKLIAREPEQRFQSARVTVDVLEALSAKFGPSAKAEANAQDASKQIIFPVPPAAPAVMPAVTPTPQPARRLSRVLAHPVSIALVSVVATVLLLFGLSQALGWFWRVGPASVPAGRDAGPTVAEEAAEFKRLLQNDEGFRANPARGADAWAEFLARFPQALLPRQEYARSKLELYLKLSNEALLPKKPAPPVGAVERPPGNPPPPPPENGLDF